MYQIYFVFFKFCQEKINLNLCLDLGLKYQWVRRSSQLPRREFSVMLCVCLLLFVRICLDNIDMTYSILKTVRQFEVIRCLISRNHMNSLSKESVIRRRNLKQL